MKITSTSFCTLVFTKFANLVKVSQTTMMFVIQIVPISTQKEIILSFLKGEIPFLGPVHMEASQPAYRAGSVGETTFILSSYGEIPARLPRQKLDTCQR